MPEQFTHDVFLTHPKVVATVEVPSHAGAGEVGRRPGEGCVANDIPALEFIVFLRAVKSRILWEQMLGRDTRLCPDINKSKFVVFDCFVGTLIQYFRNVSSFDIEMPSQTPLTLPEVIENIWQNVDRDYHVRTLAKRLLRIDKDMNAEALNAKGRARIRNGQCSKEPAFLLRENHCRISRIRRAPGQHRL